MLENIIFKKVENPYQEQQLLSILNTDHLELNISSTFSSSNYIYNQKNAPNNSPKVIVKNNLVYFFCQFCNSIHSIQIANYPGFSKINYDKISKDTWIWNEDVIKPTFYPCIHMDKNNDCVLNIQSGLISSGNSRIQEIKALEEKATFHSIYHGKKIPRIFPMLSIDKWPIKIN